MDKAIDKRIIRKERRRKVLLWCAGGAVAVAAVCWLVADVIPSVNSRDITLAEVDRGPLDVAVAATGQIVPAYEETITSPVSTRVLKAFAQPGDTVTAGTPLLQLDLEQEQIELEKRHEALIREEHSLRQMQLSNHTELSDLEMRIKVSEMNLNRLKIDVVNERRLDSIGSGTGERVRQAETALSSGILELQQLRTRLQNERERLAAAEQTQRLNVSSAQREIALANKTIHQGSIPAPLDGVLTFVVSEPGARISSGEKVAVVSDLTRFKINGDVAEGLSEKVQVGSRVNVRVNGAQLTGTVSNITPQANQGAVSFVVSLDNPSESHLRSGGRAELYVLYAYKDDVLRLRNGSYYSGAGEYNLFVLDGSNRLVRRKIQAGGSNREYVEITGGLREGDRVVVSDMERYKNKGKLKIK